MIGPIIAAAGFAALIIGLLWLVLRKPPPKPREGQRDIDPYVWGAGPEHRDYNTDGHS